MRTNRILRALVTALALSLFLLAFPGYTPVAEPTPQQSAPVPLLAKGQPVDWWFVFKLNSAGFPECGAGAKKACPFGGTVKNYKDGQQWVSASSASPTLKQGSGCAGTTGTDPLGATFEQVYNGSFNYLIWNDQFYDDPIIAGCKKECGGPWGHSKGMLAWNNAGEGFVMQVSTPSWPGAGSKAHPRNTGNTLGCVDDDDVMVSQHFFALKLNKDDLINVLKALQNASIVTDPKNPQIVNNGGPADVQALVNAFGKRSSSTTFITTTLSSGVQLISKPSNLNVPPWQMVSSILGGVDLRTATWWASPFIPTTTASTRIKCWDKSLAKSGVVQIATTGSWNGTTIGLTGGASPDHNHAKVGVSLPGGDKNYAIFGDMNQQGSLSGPICKSSQNGRGGLFYVIDDKELSESVSALIKGKTAPTTLPKKKPARST